MNVYAQTLLDAAYAAFRERRYAEAFAVLGFVAGSGWRDALTFRFLAHLEDLRGDTRASVGWLSAAIAIDPANATAHSHHADALYKLDRLGEAETAYRQAIALDPNLTEAHGGLVHVLHLLIRDDEALAWAEISLRGAQDPAHAHRILGSALVMLNRHAEAIEQFRAAQHVNPNDATARNHEGMALLSLGQFDEGWERYDARRSASSIHTTYRKLPQPLWQGDADIDGQTILVHAEQGLGDTIQFLRYVPLVAGRGATVWLEVPRPLRRLAASIEGVAGVIVPGDPLPECALQCPMLNLPMAFGTGADNIPAQVPYIHTDRQSLAAWRHRLGPAERRRIGIAWSGNPSLPENRLRSIPLAALQDLLQREDCEFHIVQTGHTDAGGMHDHSAALSDFADTAALMTQLDLIISVDSAPAHLAGALGRPTWLLLQFSADWRWLRGRADSPWYPTMRLFRQPRPGDWDSVVAEVSRALDGLGGTNSSEPR
ncbi:MAG TPA: tetratricopeptide repeat-containing glycosyltransferase family protein [Acetobacteraceae bacterium]|nr:tetratricopeptide repeat-containing glycosyltransferase family protein [Acetobacteraceae bacterium]